MAGEPIYAAIYELASPGVMEHEAWFKARDKGRFMSGVRPHTKNRSRTVYKCIHPSEVKDTESTANYIFLVRIGVEPENEAEFNRIYDTEHQMYVTHETNGVISGARYEAIEGEPKYSAIYELESPDVRFSAEWQLAAEKGQWATQIRPHTKNRYHTIDEFISRV